MNRREFLKFHAAGLLWMFAGGTGILLPKKIMAGQVPDLAVAKGSPAAATRAAVELLGGMKQFVKPGNRVVIKPNMSFPSPPERASNTHPDVVRALASMCQEVGAERILVLDHTLAPEELCMERSGIREACKPISEKMVYTPSDESLYKATDIPDGKSMTSTDIMKEVLKSDVLIAAPVAKSHSSAGDICPLSTGTSFPSFSILSSFRLYCRMNLPSSV